MIKKNFAKLFMLLFFSSSILTIVACNNEIKREIIVEDDLKIWNANLAKIKTPVAGSDFFVGIPVQAALKYVKKEKALDDAITINIDKENKNTTLVQGDNLIKLEIWWKNNNAKVNIKINDVPTYEDFLDSKLTNSYFEFTTDNNYEDLIDAIKKDINKEEILIKNNFDLKTKLPPGNSEYKIEFCYEQIKVNKSIKILTKKTDEYSLTEIAKHLNELSNFTTNNTYQDILNGIETKINEIPMDFSKLDKNNIKITFINKNLDLLEFLPENFEKIDVQLKYGENIANISVKLENFQKSKLDYEIDKITNTKFLDFTSYHTYQNILDEINGRTDSNIVATFVDKNIKLDNKLPIGPLSINTSFELDKVTKLKLIEVVDIKSFAGVLEEEANAIINEFDKLKWTEKQTYQDIYNKIKELLQNKKINLFTVLTETGPDLNAQIQFDSEYNPKFYISFSSDIKDLGVAEVVKIKIKK